MSGQRGIVRLYVLLLAVGVLLGGVTFWRSIPQPGAAAAAMRLWGPLPPESAAVWTTAQAGRSTGPQIRTLTQPTGMDGFPDWHPDGKSLAFMRDGKIWSMAADGSNPRRLTTQAGAWDVAPAWAPDGSAIAFIRYPESPESGAQALLLALRPDGKVQELAREPELIGYAAWAPDARRIAYTMRSHVVILDLPSGTKQVLYSAPEGADLLPGGVAWSRDGRNLVFGASFHTGGPRRYELFRLPLDGGTAAIQALTTRGGIMPNLSPNGRLLAFREPRDRSGLHVLDLTTGKDATQAADSGRHLFFHPKWAPDGKSLVASRLVLPAGQSGQSGQQGARAVDAKLTSGIVLVPYP